MYWLSTKNVVVSFPRFRSLALLLRSPAHKFTSFRSSPLLPRSQQCQKSLCFKERMVLKGAGRVPKKVKELTNELDEKNLSHIMWWKERMQLCKKPSTVQLVKRLIYSNLLGVDANLKNGSLKEGTLNWEILQFKSRFPREVLLCRVGDFYEVIGIDACILVEYAGLNPFGGLRSDSIPRAGCPVVKLDKSKVTSHRVLHRKMEEARKAALAYYEAGSEDQRKLFDLTDADAEGRGDLHEYISFLTERGDTLNKKSQL